MIDGLYNCTAMLNDPSSARRYKISGFFRMRETLHANEAAYADKPEWVESLKFQRSSYEEGLRINGISTLELDNKKNKWLLLGDYLQGADTLHKQFLRKLTLGSGENIRQFRMPASMA